MDGRLPLLLLSLVMTACGEQSPDAQSSKMAEFWQERTTPRSWTLNGPGGAALAPNPKATFTLLKADPRDSARAGREKDDHGQEWSIKLGRKREPSRRADRLGHGISQPIVYCRTLHSANGSVKAQVLALSLKPSTQKSLGSGLEEEPVSRHSPSPVCSC